MQTPSRFALFVLVMVVGAVHAQAPPRSGGHPAQRVPSDVDFPTGPAIGDRLPDFVLPNQRGERVDFHADRAGQRAAILFQRSAVW